MKYQIIYTDCPWKFSNRNTGGSMKSGSANRYPTMSVSDICRLKVNEIAAENCLLASWWVGTHPTEALKVMKAWGFELKTMNGFVWHKLSSTGNKDHFGMGFLTRQGAECCLFAVKGKPKKVSSSVRSLIVAPVREHSRKPDETRDRLVELMGDVPRIELFATEKTPGWSCWGNEVESDIELEMNL